MEKSVMIYDGDRLVMELIVIEERNCAQFAIKKANVRRIISREKFFMYIDIARYIGHTVYDYTGF